MASNGLPRVMGRIVLAVVMLVGAFPASALPIHFDCFFPEVQGECRELETAFVSAVGVVERTDRESAAVVVTIRGAAVDAGVRYAVSVRGAVRGDDVSVDIADRIPNAIPADAVLVRLVNLLERAIAPALELETSGSTEGGVLTLKLADPLAIGLAQARADTATTGWYVRPGVNGTWSIGNTEQLFIFLGGRLNYSNPHWRLSTDLFGGYTRISDLDVGSTPFEATFLGHDSQVVHSLGAGFSLRTALLQAHDSADNQVLTNRGFVGVEWIRSSFLQSDSSNFGVRYQLGGEHVNLITKNARGRLAEDFLLHDASAFVSWHFDRVDLELSGAFRSILDDLTYSTVSGTGNVVFRLTDELNINLFGSAAYRNQLINAPAEKSDDTLEQIFGGNFGALATVASVGITWTFGNALIDRQDRRWQ